MSDGLGEALVGDEPTILVDASEFVRFKVLGTDKTANSDLRDERSE